MKHILLSVMLVMASTTAFSQTRIMSNGCVLSWSHNNIEAEGVQVFWVFVNERSDIELQVAADPAVSDYTAPCDTFLTPQDNKDDFRVSVASARPASNQEGYEYALSEVVHYVAEPTPPEPPIEPPVITLTAPVTIKVILPEGQ